MGAMRGVKSVVLEVNVWVRRAEAEALDAKIMAGVLDVVVLMPLAVAVKRQAMIGRSMVTPAICKTTIC